MERYNLKSSLQFGETLKSVSDSDYRRLRDNYDALLKQPLQLGFFVPTDLENNILPEPQMRPEMNSFDEEDVDYDAQELYEYIEAKKRVLFKGFELYNDENTIRYNNIFIEKQDFKKGLIIESLKSYCSTTSIELTDSAIEQIGL